MFAQLKPQIDALVQMAGQGSDPVGAADLLFDQLIINLPDDYYDRLYDLIEGVDFVKKAAIFNPAVNNHQPWFAAFKTQVISRYDAEEKAAQSAPTSLQAQG